MSVFVDPTIMRVELQNWDIQYLASNSVQTFHMPIPGNVDKATLFSLQTSATGLFKFKMYSELYGQRKLLATMFTSNTNPTMQMELGNTLDPNTTLVIEAQNLDNWPCDAYVTLRYAMEDAYEAFSKRFHKELEARLDTVK